MHIQYAYDTRAVVLVNHTLTDEHGLQARIRVRNLDGSVRYERRLQDIDLARQQHAAAGDRCRRRRRLSRTYFIELELASADGKPVSRNVYWLSTQPDTFDWPNSNWYLTPLTQYADLTALQIPAGRDQRGARVDAARGGTRTRSRSP